MAALIYPPACPVCRAEVAEQGGLCAACWREIAFISGAACRTCGAPVSPGLGAEAFCDGCAQAPPSWSRGAAAVVYGGAARTLVLGLKHGDRLDVAPLAARWMMGAGGGLGARLAAEADLIVPVPLHWSRLLKRRYNQSGELTREIAALAGRRDAAALDLLARFRRTPSQEGKSQSERFANVGGVFAVSRRWRRRIAGRRVLLIDDVLTTGATLSACSETCRAAGAADVNVLVFARVARVDWPT